MSQAVDVYVTDAELAEGRRTKKTTCLKIDRSALMPVLCVSKQGISTAALFATHEKRREGRYLTDAEMGLMYDKFVGPGSLNNAALRHEQHERGTAVRSSPAPPGSRVPSIDSGDRGTPTPPPGLAVAIAAAGPNAPVAIQAAQLAEKFQQQAEQALQKATMKYVAPNIARRYGIEQHIKPASAIAAAASAAAARNAVISGAAGATAGGARHRGNGAAAAAASPRSPGGGSAAATTPRSGVSGSSVISRPAAAAAAADDVRPVGPPSFAFKSVARDRAKCVGTKFLYGGPSGVPGPAKYSPKYGAVEKGSHAIDWSRSAASASPGGGAGGGAGGTSGAGGAGGAAASGGERIGAWRPGSAPASGRTHARPGSAPSPSRRGDAGETGGAVSGVAAAGGGCAYSRSRSMGGGGHRPSGMGIDAAAAAAGVRSQTAVRHAELFAGAHRVHGAKPPKPPGTQPFKASERKTPDASTVGSHLFGEYYTDGYDKLTRRSSRPSSAFGRQTARPGLAPGSLPAAHVAHGETSPALGPGVYGAKGELPGTYTGRHVNAGHSPLARTADWSRGSSRPCSAPPSGPASRPTSAAAVQRGYWGPDGPTESLFPDDPAYQTLVALRVVQEQTAQRGRTTSRPASAVSNAAAGPYGIVTVTGSGFGGAATGSGFGDGAAADGGGDGGSPRPLVYVDPTRHSELGSAGLAKRVQGGPFGKATREEAAHTLRAMSDNKVTPPAAVATKAVQDLSYTYDISVEGHRGRPPSWGLPPNRAALSAKWVGAAASALMETIS